MKIKILKSSWSALALMLFLAGSAASFGQAVYSTPYAFTNFAGSVGVASQSDGQGASAQFDGPIGLAVDSAGNIYVADQIDCTIRKIDTNANVSTIGGIPYVAAYANGGNGSSLFDYPEGVAVDAAGNVYVVDCYNFAIRKIDTNYNTTTLAGGNYGYADGKGTAAAFAYPSSIAIDGSGNCYVVDAYNQLIRKVSPAGDVSTVAGTYGLGGRANANGTSASFYYPFGIAVDRSGILYVTDEDNHEIRKIDQAANVTLIAGSASGATNDTDGFYTAAGFNHPAGIALDSLGNLFVADIINDTVRKIDPYANVTTIAGVPGVSGFSDGVGSSAGFYYPFGMAVDASGAVYVADYENQRITKGINPKVTLLSATRDAVQPTSVTVVFNQAVAPSSAANPANYSLNNAKVSAASVNAGSSTVTLTTSPLFYNEPHKLTVNNVQNASQNGSITANSMVVVNVPGSNNTSIYAPFAFTNYAGYPGVPGSADGNGTSAFFDYPDGITVDSSGNVYVADFLNCTIRKIDTSGNTTTLAGSAGIGGLTDGTGSSAQFYYPFGLTMDNQGNIIVADQYNHAIRKVTTAGVVTTIAGGTPGSADGNGASAQFYYPADVAVDSAGNIYVADEDNFTIRKIDSSENVTTIAGTAGTSGSANGQGTSAQFSRPTGLTVDNSGNIYVADSQNDVIRKLDSSGNVTTFAGTTGLTGSVDGGSAVALFNNCYHVTEDGHGNLIVADTGNNLIRRVDSSGNVTTLGGLAGIAGMADGIGSGAGFDHPSGSAVDSSGNLYVVDEVNFRVTKGVPSQAPPTIVSATRDYMNPKSVTVVLSDAVTPATATSLANYSLDDGDSVTTAVMGNNVDSVVLTTSALFNNAPHVLTVNNVQTVNGATIAPGSQMAVTVPDDTYHSDYIISGTNDAMVLEAEDYGATFSGGGAVWLFTVMPPLWTPNDANTNYSGSGAMVSLPDAGRNLGNGAGVGNPVPASPAMSYPVLFRNAGTYYVWVRGLGDSSPGPSDDDSVFIGLDNALTTGLTGFPQGAGYTWGNTAAGPGANPITVTTPGFHTINVWMREDGMCVDKVLLTKQPYNAYTPAGFGPAESPLSPGPAINAAQTGASLALTWFPANGGALQSAPNAAGPYTNVAGAASGYTVSPAGLSLYYRVKY